MSSKQEIVNAIQDSNTQVTETVSGLSEAEAQKRVGDGGWTIKEVLSHMAGRKPTYERLFATAQGQAPVFTGSLDPDERNAGYIKARENQTFANILTEFLNVHEWVMVEVQGLPEATLGQQVTLGQRQVELGDLIQLAAATHTLNHLQEIKQALGKA